MRLKTGAPIEAAKRNGRMCQRLIGAGIAAAAALSAHSAEARRAVVVHRYAADGWIVNVVDDRFAEEKRCVLRSRSGTMIYQPGAIGFVTRSRDTLNAVYRIDGAQPVRWQDRYPALIAAGIEIDGGNLGNPTGGIVWIPEAELERANIVAVRTGNTGWGRRFVVRGAMTMIGVTRRLGCVPVTSF